MGGSLTGVPRLPAPGAAPRYCLLRLLPDLRCEKVTQALQKRLGRRGCERAICRKNHELFSVTGRGLVTTTMMAKNSFFSCASRAQQLKHKTTGTRHHTRNYIR